MRTALLILTLSALSAFGQAWTFNDPAWLAQQKAASGGGGCVVNAGDLLNESFEGSVDAGWTAEGTSPTWGAALPGTSPCSGLGSKTLGAVTTGAGLAGYYYDFGSLSTQTRYWRFYLYVDSTSQASTDKDEIFEVGEGSDPTIGYQFYVDMVMTGSQLTLIIGTGLGMSSAINISVATWYRVEVQTIYNGVGTLKVYDASGSLLGTVSQNAGAANNQIRYAHFGLIRKDNSQNCTLHIDGVGASSTGYLGQ